LLAEEADEAKKQALEKRRTKYIEEIKRLEAVIDAAAMAEGAAAGASAPAPLIAPAAKPAAVAGAGAEANAEAPAGEAAAAEPVHVPEPVTATFGKFKEQWATIGFKKEEIEEFIKGIQVPPSTHTHTHNHNHTHTRARYRHHPPAISLFVQPYAFNIRTSLFR
jgi:membrane-bound lytic murein transglycosylase B